MKIAIIYDRFYPEDIGGAEKRNWEIARRLVRKGHEVWVVSMQHWPGDAVVVREGVVCAGVAPAMPTFKPDGRRSIIEPFYFAWHLFTFLRRHRFDLVDCGNFPYLSCFVAKVFALRVHVPLIITWFETRGGRGWWAYSRWTGLLAYPFEIIVARLSRHNVAISPLTFERAGQLFPSLKGKMSLVACGVEAPPSSGPGSPRPWAPQLFYMGRLVKHKRIDWLIEAMRVLGAEFPELRLILIGQGPEEASLIRKADALGLREKIRFQKFLTQEELDLELRRSGIFVLPSEQEGFGLVLIEAMAAGVPVVAADAPLSAARTLMESGRNGLLVPSCEDMIAAIRRLIREAPLRDRLVGEGLKTAQCYDWDSVVIPQLEAYYRQVASASVCSDPLVSKPRSEASDRKAGTVSRP